MTKYVHGYSLRETSRLNDQADTLDDLLHNDTIYKNGEIILEAGCGVGAQTKIIAAKNPEAQFISVDISSESVKKATDIINSIDIHNVEFKTADIFNLPFTNNFFDHIFVCFVLEHLPNPELALKELMRVLKHKGSITVIEGDHGSVYFYPDCPESRKVIQSQVDLQKRNGGNALIGRELYPLLNTVGFKDVHVSPRMVYVDNSKPALVEGFTKNTFTSMIEGIKNSALNNKLIDEMTFDSGIKGLYRATETDGVFCYTFFKAKGYKV